MRALSCLLSVAVLVSATAQSWGAATVSSTPTGVSVVTHTGNSRVRVGDVVEGRIVVGRGSGETVLSFEDGCEVRLKPGQVYTVPSVSPCGAAAQNQPLVPPAETGLGMGAAAVAGVAVAGIIAGGVIAATSGKKSSNPVYISP